MVIDALEFVVAEAAPRDAGRGLARVSPADLERLGVRAGGVIVVSGERSTAVRALPSRPEDRDRGVLLDGLARENAGSSIGAKVRVARLEPVLARSVVLEVISGAGVAISDLKTLLQDRALTAGDRVRVELFGSKVLELRVKSLEPGPHALVGGESRLALENVPETTASAQQNGSQSSSSASYEDIGGLSREVARVRELVELPLRYPQVFEQLGIDPPKGVLLYGPPGTGKTTIARAVARETRAHFISVAGPEIIGKFYGDSEKRLREIFQEARAKAPSIIFLDEIDAIGPKRSEVQGEVEKRVVAQLLSLMDGLGGRGQVVVIGATNLPDNLDPALRRPGRFDREVVINPPDARGRREILEVHTRAMPLMPDVNLDDLARITHGFVGADLAALAREAGMHRVRSQLPTWTASGRGPSAQEMLQLEVGMEDFRAALREVSPSLIRETESDITGASWTEIGGLSEVKAALIEAVEAPLKHPELFAQLRLEPPRGILLAGPPGTGKTLTARAVAKESEANFIAVRGAQFLSRYYGESEKAVRELFRKARASAPCVVFFDEIDALLANRADADAVSSRVIGQFLAEMDGISSLGNVIILGATNRPESLDPALLRPGRFERVLEFKLPSESDREEILSVHLRGRATAGELNLDALAAKTQGWSGADLEWLVRRAAMFVLQAHLAKTGTKQNAKETCDNESISLEITQSDLENALEEVKASKR
jgi:transitional endoplasmic reticulum ATPase